MNFDEEIYRCDKMISILENERIEISQGLQGEICRIYTEIIDAEIELLENAKRKLYYLY